MHNLEKTIVHYLAEEKDDNISDVYSYGLYEVSCKYMANKGERAGLWRGIAIGIPLGAMLIAAIVTATSARAETIDGDRVIILDGDTIALPCDPLRGLYPGCGERLRLVGVDAPETGSRARCEAESSAGSVARAALAAVIRGRSVEITRIGRDRYGRTLARLKAGDRDVDEAMLAAGHAIPYAPGRAAWAKRCRHWCPGNPRCEE